MPTGMIGVRHTPLDICRRVDAGCGHNRDEEDEWYGNDDDEKQSGMVAKHEEGRTYRVIWEKMDVVTLDCRCHSLLRCYQDT